VRKLVPDAAENGLLDLSTARTICSIKGAPIKGTRTGKWLSRSQAQELLDAPGTATLKAKRDTAILAVLLGAGLRRSEVSAVSVEQTQQRDGRCVVVDLRGKAAAFAAYRSWLGSRVPWTAGR